MHDFINTSLMPSSFCTCRSKNKSVTQRFSGRA